MTKLTFIDSDILFSFFAINKEKENKYFETGSIDNEDLDSIMKLIEEIESNNETICLSEISVLEILCTINRQKSSFKIPTILTKIYKFCDILPLNNLLIKLSWFIGSNYNYHSGDALHISFCLFNNIKKMILKDKVFYESCLKIKDDYKKKGFQEIETFFQNIDYAQGVPERILQKFSNIENLIIKRI